MASKFFSERNLRFLLYEVFDVVSLTRYDDYKEYDGKTFDMVLKAAIELAEGLLWPIFQEMDNNPPELVEDRIKVHPSVKKFLEEAGEGGWIGADIPFEWGGQQLPRMITLVARFIFCAANYSAGVYPAIATAAYYAALDYSKKRLQGRRLSTKDPTLPQVPIIEHPDVKRMLLFQRSIAEGSLALLIQCGKYADLAGVLTGAEKEKNELLLDLLTPVAKTYPSEMGLLSISAGLQCLGGSGYCDDYPLEQYYRDARIHPIHEGTTGIHGLDLLGRKVVMKGGKAYKLYLDEVQGTIRGAEKFEELQSYAEKLNRSLEMLQKVTGHLMDVAKKETPELSLSDATLYLEFFGIISVAWQWLVQATAVVKALRNIPGEAERNFYSGKFFTFRYFFEYELPKMEGLARRLMNGDGLTVEIKPEYFSD